MRLIKNLLTFFLLFFCIGIYQSHAQHKQNGKLVFPVENLQSHAYDAYNISMKELTKYTPDLVVAAKDKQVKKVLMSYFVSLAGKGQGIQKIYLPDAKAKRTNLLITVNKGVTIAQVQNTVTSAAQQVNAAWKETQNKGMSNEQAIRYMENLSSNK